MGFHLTQTYDEISNSADSVSLLNMVQYLILTGRRADFETYSGTISEHDICLRGVRSHLPILLAFLVLS